MTPTDAREITKTAFGPSTARTVITKLADQVEALTKERDSLGLEITGWKADQKENLNNQCDMADKVMGQARLLQQARIERDASLKQNTMLDARCAKLEEAAKLAFKALCRINDAPLYLDHSERLSLAKAITALRQAGVQ